MGRLARCTVSGLIGREAGVSQKCYRLKGNLPARLRQGDVFTVDGSILRCEGALCSLSIPFEPLRPGPVGKLFAVDATDAATNVTRARPDLDAREPALGHYDMHCRNVYFAAMATYETFRRALGRPVAWAFWTEDHYPPLRLKPFAEAGLNAFYDRDDLTIGFGYGPAGEESLCADRQLTRFTALSSDVVVHEVTHALIDGLRPDYDIPVNPDVFAFHEALADVIALLSRFQRPGYLDYLLRQSGFDFLRGNSLISLAPELGRLMRQSGLRTLDVAWTDLDQAPDPRQLYDTAPDTAHERGGLLSSAIFEAFLRALDRRIRPLIRLAAPSDSALGRYLLEEIQQIAARTAGHFLSICVRALDYCPPAAILFSDYLRAIITADRLLAPQDRFGYREELIYAFLRRGIFPAGIEMASEAALTWDAPEVPVFPIPGLALSQLRYEESPTLPFSAAEIRIQARSLALAIDADPRLARELGLRDKIDTIPDAKLYGPEITSIRPTLRIGPDGYIDFSIIAEIVQNSDIPAPGGGFLRHRGGATLIIDQTGKPSMIVRQRSDNENRLLAESAYLQKAINRGDLQLKNGHYVPNRNLRRRICGGH